MKRCNRCLADLPVAAFGAHKRDGLKSRCRPCISLDQREARQRNPKKRVYQPPSLDARERMRLWRLAHPDRMRAYEKKWVAANPELVRERTQRHRAKLLERYVEKVDVRVLAERDQGRCGICLRPVPRPDWSIDHILPVTFGGEHSYANTRLTHILCNTRRQHRGHAQLRMIG